MLEIRYKNYVFHDEDIDLHPNVYRAISLLSTSLEYDVFNWRVKSDAAGEQKVYNRLLEWLATASGEGIVVNNGDFAEFTKGDPVQIYEDGSMKAEFYVDDISLADLRDDGDELFSVRCYSVLGILSRLEHRGGIYNGVPAGLIIEDIMQGLSYTIDGDVASVLLYGWLPYSKDARKNLEKVMFATGAHVVRNANGTVRIAYNRQDVAKQIPKGRLFRTALNEKKERRSKVVVTEHSYFTSEFTAEEVVFDNILEAVASQRTIKFDEPYYDYRADGLTIIESSANWARVSGVGTLYAKKYIHVQRDVSRIIDAENDNDIISFGDQTLVSSINVNGIVDRLANYYSNAKIKQIDFEVADERPGDLIEFSDRRTSGITGYIQDLDETASSFWRGRAKVVTNWTPTTPGNYFDSYEIIKGSDLSSGVYWNVPAELQGKRARIVLFSGAEGGQGGWYGETMGTITGDGASAYYVPSSGDDEYNLGNPGPIQRGGSGGQGGNGGAGATRFINVDVDNLPSRYFVVFGEGGEGGEGGQAIRGNDLTLTEIPPEDGQPGGASRIRAINSSVTYSTDDGSIFRGTYINLITGEVIIRGGNAGQAGAAGGSGGISERISKNYATEAERDAYSYAAAGKGSNGEGLAGYSGGAGAPGSTGIRINAYSGNYVGTSREKPYTWYANPGGGGGGGAALGSAGGAGSAGQAGSITIRHLDGHVFDHYEYLYYANKMEENEDPESEHYHEYTISGARGGDGANATAIPDQPIYVGGTGGAGGGGGGGAGQCLGSTSTTGSTSRNYNGSMIGGKGGNGGKGGKGSDGFMIVYYKGDE